MRETNPLNRFSLEASEAGKVYTNLERGSIGLQNPALIGMTSGIERWQVRHSLEFP